MPPSSERVLVFGGTFDPPHRAHRDLPQRAARLLGCARILYVPAALNPLKLDTPPTADAHRLRMLELALRDVPEAEISTLELDRGGPSYTIDTIETVRERLDPETRLHLLIGADQALEFHRWKDWRRLETLAAPAVMLRPPWDAPRFRAALEARFDPAEVRTWLDRVLDLPLIDVHATAVRERLRNGRAIDDLVHPDVAEYIRAHGLYRPG